jgi:glucose-6-phosphate isomerase
MGVNPFGQPNVAAAKAATAGVLDGSLAAPPVTSRTTAEAAGVTFAGALSGPTHAEASLGTAVGHAVAALGRGDFLAVLAYLPDDPELLEPLVAVVPAIAAELGVPVTLELGPRYLHSTGQLHKGGADNGVFVVVSTRDGADVPVPGRPWGLRSLHAAQAAGDLVTLTAAGRRVLWLELPDAGDESVARLTRGLADAAGVVTEDE